MTLHLQEGPAEGLEWIRQYVPMLLDAEGHPIDGAEPLEIARPYPLYTSTMEAVMENRLLASSRLTAWAYLIVQGDSVVALGEVAAANPEYGQALGFATLHPREYADAITSALASAENHPHVAERPYDVRILRAPGVSLLAIWLHNPDEDVLLPLRPPPSHDLDGGLLTNETALTELLRPLAEQRLQAWNL